MKKTCPECKREFSITRFQHDKVYCGSKCQRIFWFKQTREREQIKRMERRKLPPIVQIIVKEEEKAEQPIRTVEQDKVMAYIEKKYEWYKSPEYLEVLLLKLKLYE